jgi:hypothetical protein
MSYEETLSDDPEQAFEIEAMKCGAESSLVMIASDTRKMTQSC